MQICLLVLPCEASPCQNKGVCTNLGGARFKCTCKDGYGGLICDKKGKLCTLATRLSL
jgi:hypothetical protein